jgi:fimbrial isopeptide formation D2 family protein/uncharacterized repeat protein (TIGR01451 family)
MAFISASVRRARFLLIVVCAVAFLPTAAHAAGTPDLQLSGGPAPSVLYGDTVPVTLTAALGSGQLKGYNLAFRTVLPAGTHYVAGSAGTDDGEPQVLADAPTTGKTTLIWANVSDLVAASSHTLSFRVAYNDTAAAATPRYDVGDTLPIDTGAYISTAPRDVTDFSATGLPVGPGAGTYTGKAEQSTTTSLTAIKVEKSEPHPEGEIPRGVHDHQTVYTLKVTNNSVNPTNAVALEDYLPAGLEFLGCAGTADHTADAPTNPGSAEEYPGSGAITVTQPTGAAGCAQPDLVETVSLDPDGSGPLAAGVYTHVRWNVLGDFVPGATRTVRYAAAIPLRENTLDWNGAAAGLGAAPADQTANLDNNAGLETSDEQPLLNGAIVSGTYVAPSRPGLAVSDEGTLLRTAEDIAIQKTRDNGGLEQGDLTKWTIDVQVSEYRSVDDVTIHDVVPDGLCPLGPVNAEHTPPAARAECDPVAGKGPSQPYTTADEQADGTFDITWDKSTAPSLAHLEPSETRQLTFWTRTRDHYQQNFADAGPILSKDAVSNKIDVTGTDWVRCVGATPDCAAAGTKIDHDEVDGEPDVDVSGAGKQASGPVLLKQVAAHYPASGDCGDLATADYGKTVPTYGPGDRVCWKLRLDFPQKLNTTSQDVFDILPDGLTYVPGTAHATAVNSVPLGTMTASADGQLSWPIGNDDDVDHGGQIFEVTFASTVGSIAGHQSGDVEGNLMKFSYENTAGTSFPLRDLTDFALKLPQLNLVKGIRAINGATPVNGPNTNVDHQQVRAGDAVEFRVDVTNAGSADASSSRVWDVLPAGMTCADIQAGTISDGGTCNALANRLQWTGIPVAHGATTSLTYVVVVPAGVSPDQTFINTAGVVEYTYTANDGSTFQLVPDNDVVKDGSLPAPNAPRAQDVSDVYTPVASVAKARTTTVTESGNTTGQATVGERVTYTVTTIIPAGTTLYGTPTVVDDLGVRQTYVPDTLTATLNGAALPAGMSAAVTGNVVTATFPATYVNAVGDDTLVMTLQAKVLDVAANVRSATLPNTATLAFKDQLERTVTHSSSVSTTIVEPKLAVTKSHTPSGRIAPGQLVTFTVRAGNASGTNISSAHEAVVVDTLPAGTDPVDAAGNPLADGAAVPVSGGLWNAAARTITWTKATTSALALIAPGGGVNLTYPVRLEATPVAGAQYTNAADENATSLDASVGGVRSAASTAPTATDYKSHATDVLTVALPAVTKDVTPDQVTIGNRVTWHVRVTLPKSEQYYDTTVVDTVPDGFDVDGYGAITCVSGCLAGDPAVSSFPVTSLTLGRLQAAWYLGDVAPAETDRVYDLVLTGHVRNTYRNGGAQVLAAQTLTNSVSVRTNRTNKVSGTPTTVPASGDDTAGPATSVNHVVEPRLTLVKTADKGPFVEGGTHVTYTVKLKNDGTSPAYDVLVDDQPDAELANVQLGAGVSTTLNTDGWTAGDPDLRWTVPGPIAVGETVTFTYTADVKAGAQLTQGAQILNTAKVTEAYGVPQATRTADGFVYRQYTGPQSSVALTVALPDLSIVKTPDHGTATAGTASSFTIKVTNTDTHATAHNVTVHDVLQSGLAYTAGAATAAPATGFSETGASGQTIDWKVASLAPGASVTITVPVAVAASTASGTTLLNTASTHADEVPADKTDTGSLDVITRADLQVTKTSVADPVIPGTTIVYTLVVKNNGPSDALASKLEDTLPTGLTFVSSDDAAHCAAAGQVISCDYGTLVPGASRTVHVTVRIDPSRTTSILNAADVTTTTTETTTANNHAEVTNTVKPTADVSIRKTADKAVYLGGDTVTYTLVAHNDGPSTATGVTVDDDIPDALTFVAATAPCTQAAGHVHCALGTLLPGADRTVTITTKAKGTPPPPSGSSDTHKITVFKAEEAQALQAGETKTFTVTCAENGLASDGSVEVMHVDDGTGSSADVQVLDAHSTAPGGYRFTVRNTTTGQAQVKLFVTCLPHDTDPAAHTHPLELGSLQTVSTGTLTPGRYSFTIPTSGAHRAAAPGIEVLSGVARLVGGEPDGTGWRFTVEVLETATANLSLRALSDYTGLGGDPAHVHGFTFQHVVRTLALPPGESVQRVSCPVGYKGITATYDLPPGIVSLGNEPQPINRDFRLLNTTGHDVDVMLDLECMSIDTGPAAVLATVVNTGMIGSSTFDPVHANDVSSATIGVERAPGPLEAPAVPAAPAAPSAPPAPSADPAPAGRQSAAPTARVAAPSLGTFSVATTGATAVVPVTCASACSGTVTVTAIVATSTLRATGGAKTKKVILGKARYTAKAGRTVKVTVKIAASYRKLLRTGRVRSVSVTVGGRTVAKKVVLAKKKATKKPS